jgi:hypothetical protein
VNLDEARRAAREHADVCIEPSCHALANALDGADYAQALAIFRAAVDPDWRDTSDLPPWSEVSRPWPTIAFPDPRDN